MPSKFVNQLLSEINKFRADPSEITKSCELVKKGMSRINGKDPFLKEIDKFISEIQDLPEMNQLTLNPTLTKIAEEQVKEFYKLLKALFILQTESPDFYNFETNIDKNGSLEFYLEGQKIEYKHMVEFIREQYKIGLKRRKELKGKIRLYNKKLKQLQELVATQEIEYLAKEKQISTFLECKKTFFGKFKYFFKYGKRISPN